MAFLGYIAAMRHRLPGLQGSRCGGLRILGSVLRLNPLVWLLLCGIALRGSLATGAETPVSKEYQIKAAFIYNFTKFVEWPANSFGDAKTPIVIGVLGTNPFGDELRKAVEGRKVNGRELVIRLVSTPADLDLVHVLFISSSEIARFPEWCSSLRGRPVLTIAEKESFLKEGGMISFLFDGDKVRFSVNVDSAETAGLKISAQLQKLAASVRKKS